MTIAADASIHMDGLKLHDAVVDELTWAAGVDTAHIGVSVSRGAVRPPGEVGSCPKLLAAKAVQRVRVVTAIAREITVRRRGSAQLAVLDVARVAVEAVAGAVDAPASIPAAQSCSAWPSVLKPRTRPGPLRGSPTSSTGMGVRC